MPTFLSGGTGTPKLLRGLEAVFDPESVSVVANTGDDVVLGGLLVCPDVDTVLYGRADELDLDTWWGRDGDSLRTHEEVRRLSDRVGADAGPRYLDPSAQTAGREIARWRRFSAIGEFMHIGDLDRAVHLFRTSLIDEGHRLTTVTDRLREALGVTVDVLPMSDDPVATMIQTPDGEQHFQEFWVANGGEPAVESVSFRGAPSASPTREARSAIRDGTVIVGPSNPVTSIGPMLALDGIEAALQAATVVIVSPFVEDRVFSGPAAALLEATGYDASTAGVAELYPFADAFVLDEADETTLDRPVIRTDTRMDDRTDAIRVLRAVETALERV
ncbi:MAG: 2-phospho-L-lactate transferase [Halodesulfurarchaeum sp.]